MYTSSTPSCTASTVRAVLPLEWIQHHAKPAPVPVKRTLPALMPHGLFHGRRASDLVELSGLVQIDVDAKHNEGTPRDMWPAVAHAFASSSAPVELAQVSASGAGFFALLRIRQEANFHHMAEAALTVATEELEAVAARMNLPAFKLDTVPTRNLASLRFPGVGAVYFGSVGNSNK